MSNTPDSRAPYVTPQDEVLLQSIDPNYETPNRTQGRLDEAGRNATYADSVANGSTLVNGVDRPSDGYNPSGGNFFTFLPLLAPLVRSVCDMISPPVKGHGFLDDHVTGDFPISRAKGVPEIYRNHGDLHGMLLAPMPRARGIAPPGGRGRQGPGKHSQEFLDAEAKRMADQDERDLADQDMGLNGLTDERSRMRSEYMQVARRKRREAEEAAAEQAAADEAERRAAATGTTTGTGEYYKQLDSNIYKHGGAAFWNRLIDTGKEEIANILSQKGMNPLLAGKLLTGAIPHSFQRFIREQPQDDSMPYSHKSVVMPVNEWAIKKVLSGDKAGQIDDLVSKFGKEYDNHPEKYDMKGHGFWDGLLDIGKRVISSVVPSLVDTVTNSALNHFDVGNDTATKIRNGVQDVTRQVTNAVVPQQQVVPQSYYPQQTPYYPQQTPYYPQQQQTPYGPYDQVYAPKVPYYNQRKKYEEEHEEEPPPEEEEYVPPPKPKKKPVKKVAAKKKKGKGNFIMSLRS